MNEECVCNKCGRQFKYKFTHETIGTDENGGDVVQSFFTCPHCGERYNSLITDSVYKNMLAEYRKLSRAVMLAAKSNANNGKLKALVNKMNSYEKNTMKPYYAKLKKQWQTKPEETSNAD